MATTLFTPPAAAVIPPDSPIGAAGWLSGAPPTGNADPLVNGDPNNGNVVFLEISFRAGHQFTDTGLAAANGQVNTYLAAAKITAITAAHSFVDLISGLEYGNSWTFSNHKRCRCPVLSTDLAAQLSAWATLLGTGANVS